MKFLNTWRMTPPSYKRGAHGVRDSILANIADEAADVIAVDQHLDCLARCEVARPLETVLPNPSQRPALALPAGIPRTSGTSDATRRIFDSEWSSIRISPQDRCNPNRCGLARQFRRLRFEFLLA